MKDFIFDRLLPAGLAVLVVAVFLFLFVGLLDAVQSLRAWTATTAWQSHMKLTARKPFGTTVVCVPISTRQDTTLNLNTK